MTTWTRAVQTFLPFAEFSRSAAVLDPIRLGKQRVETLQVLRALELPDYGWRHHPAVTMWRGRTPALVLYGLTCVEAWTAGGRRDTTGDQIAEFAPQVVGVTQAALEAAGLLPRWIGDAAFHLSHRSALVRKDPGYYRPLLGDVPDDLPYVWPDADPGPSPSVEAGGEPVWVVRDASGGRQVDRVTVPMSAPSGRASPKWRRMVDAFVAQMAVGDVVASPVDGGGRLAVGRITGDVVASADGYCREVRWDRLIARSDVVRPALLQDPRWVFQVRLRQDAQPDGLG